MDDLTPRMQQEVERRKEDIDRIVLQAENSHLLQAEDGVEEEDSTYQVRGNCPGGRLDPPLPR